MKVMLSSMIPVTKIPKQSVSAALLERKKRLREREKNTNAKKYPSDAKVRFGRNFQSKLSLLLLSDSPTSQQQLQSMYDEVLNYYNEHELSEMWLSDDNEDNDVKPPVTKKMHMDAKVGLSRLKGSSEEKEKQKQTSTSNPPVINPNPTISISNLELSDDSDDDMAGKPSSSAQKNVKQCNVCGEGNNGDANTNVLLDCDECKKPVHMKCNKSEITLQQALDSRFVFVCSNCRDRESKVDRGTPNESSGLGKAATGKKDEKAIAHKLDISAAFATFAAKKKKIVNTPGLTSLPAAGGISRSGNNLPNTSAKTFPSFLKK